MCGISGLLTGSDPAGSAALVQRMNAIVKHRGPDDEGATSVPLPRGTATLGHRRLSILDLSTLGRQPMARGRWTVSYNGEIYNSPSLRHDLESLGCRFTTTTDTETLLWALETWGLEATVKKLDGMFAFAATDGQALHLVRDRLGIKPLYYCRFRQGWAFASELKALTTLPGFNPHLSEAALDRYLCLGHVPSPLTIYDGAFKLPPGHILELTLEGGNPRRYWDPGDNRLTGLPGSFEDCVERLDELLNTSVKSQLMADVPLGSFLSGGIDSSLVSAIAQKQLGGSLRTFSIGFRNRDFDESIHAEAVARALGTHHTTRMMDESDMLDLVPTLHTIYDEPFADSSALPTLLLSQITREKVTVALSGDGGDELFRGYPRYDGYQQLQKFDRIPAALRRGIGDLLDRLGGNRGLGLRGRALAYRHREESFLIFLGIFHCARFRELRGYDYRDRNTRLHEACSRLDHLPFMEAGALLDQHLYLPDDILTKVDRASMKHSLEVRVPLLAHPVVEFANGLPEEFTYDGGRKKRILKTLLARYLDPKLWTRPKMGFGVPLAQWLRGPLREDLTSHLEPGFLREQGLFAPAFTQSLLANHLSGKKDDCYSLWTLYMFQKWWKARNT
ncbi:MAG: asparagine synthase (glutamine-hydrolyzing) [Planctomycetota bacterium]